MKLKNWRKITVGSSSGSTVMYAAAAAESAMPIGTLASSSTRPTTQMTCILPPLASGSSVRRFVLVRGLFEHHDAAQLLHAPVEPEDHRGRQRGEAHEPRRQERRRREREASAAALVVNGVGHFGDAPVRHGAQEEEREGQRDQA